MAEFTQEMKDWLREAALGMGIPSDFIYNDPKLLVYQVRTHAIMNREGYLAIVESEQARVYGPPKPEITQPLYLSILIPKLQELFPNWPPGGFMLSDSDYQLTTLAEVGRFIAWYKKWWLPLLRYEGNWDCDNYATVFKALASIAKSWAGLSWGEIWGDGGTWGRTGHAFNIVFAMESNELKAYFIEPQDGFITEIVPEVLEGFQSWLIKI